MRTDVSFYSEGMRVSGQLYLPDQRREGEKLPAVVLCHGFAGFKELLLPPYAERFAASGLAALLFDYRGFGGSEGERGRLVPAEQVADIRNAVTFVQTLSEVDAERVGLWGTSFGGANAIYVAAADRRVKALAAQLTFASGERMIKGTMDGEMLQKLEATLQSVLERAVTRNKVLRLAPEQILTDPESKAFVARMSEEFPQLKTKIPFATLGHVMEHNPQTVIGRVRCPTLFVSAAEDRVCPPGETEVLFALASEPKKLVVLEGCRHYDAYEGTHLEKGAGAAVQWFSTHLLSVDH
jgi:fermentation-respiration switch protein FrsA (DUF1100 family)